MDWSIHSFVGEKYNCEILNALLLTKVGWKLKLKISVWVGDFLSCSTSVLHYCNRGEVSPSSPASWRGLLCFVHISWGHQVPVNLPKSLLVKDNGAAPKTQVRYLPLSFCAVIWNWLFFLEMKPETVLISVIHEQGVGNTKCLLVVINVAKSFQNRPLCFLKWPCVKSVAFIIILSHIWLFGLPASRSWPLTVTSVKTFHRTK